MGQITFSSSISGINLPGTYTWSTSNLFHSTFNNSTTGNAVNGNISNTITYDERYDESGSVILTVQDAVCSKQESISIETVSPAKLLLNSEFLPSGTGGGDCSFTSGSFKIERLSDNVIPSVYTIEMYVNNVLRNPSEYSITYNNSNNTYVITALNLGAASLASGVHQIKMLLIRNSDSLTWEITNITNACP